MLCREIIAVCSEIHTKHINGLCEQNVQLFNVKLGGTCSDHWSLDDWICVIKTSQLMLCSEIIAVSSQILSTSLNLLQLLRDCWERLKWSYVCEVRYENGPAKVWTTLCHQILCKPWRIRYCDLWKVTKGLWRTFFIQGTSVQMAQVLFRM